MMTSLFASAIIIVNVVSEVVLSIISLIFVVVIIISQRRNYMSFTDVMHPITQGQ